MRFCPALLTLCISILLAKGTLGQELVDPSTPLAGLADIGRSSSVFVAADQGGILQTLAEDGTEWTLFLPPNALPEDMEVTFAPLSVIAQPGDVPIRGFDIQPAGTMLLLPATVTVVPGQGWTDVPREHLFLLETSGVGPDLVGYAAFPSKAAPIAMHILHFSGGAVAQAGQDWVRFLHGPYDLPFTPDTPLETRERFSGTTRDAVVRGLRALQAEIAQKVGTDRLDPERGGSQIAFLEAQIAQALNIESEREITERLRRTRERMEALQKPSAAEREATDVIEEAAKSGRAEALCRMSDAMATLLQAERQRQLLGISELPGVAEQSAASQRAIEAGLIGFMEASAARCGDGQINVAEVLGLTRQAMLLGIISQETDESLMDPMTRRWNKAKDRILACPAAQVADAPRFDCRKYGVTIQVELTFDWPVFRGDVPNNGERGTARFSATFPKSGLAGAPVEPVPINVEEASYGITECCCEGGCAEVQAVYGWKTATPTRPMSVRLSPSRPNGAVVVLDPGEVVAVEAFGGVEYPLMDYWFASCFEGFAQDGEGRFSFPVQALPVPGQSSAETISCQATEDFGGSPTQIEGKLSITLTD